MEVLIFFYIILRLMNLLRQINSLKIDNTMQSNTITFVTGNENKLREFTSILGPNLGFHFTNENIDLPEYQGEIEDICIKKCEEAKKLLNTPIIVEDTSLCFNALGGLPGPYIKWFLEKVGSGGLYKMLQGFEDKKAIAVCTIGYATDNGSIKLFQGKTEGTIVEPRGESGFGWDKCFMPSGFDVTYAEMKPQVKDEISHRHKAISLLKTYLETLRTTSKE